MSQWMQCSFIQTTPTWADAVCSIHPDTHDGFDEDSHRKVKEEQREKDSAFNSARERLREVIEMAWDERLPGPVAAEVKEAAAPYVERLESGAPRIDFQAIERRATEMASILAFQDEMRREYQARMAELDDEEAVLTTIWN